MATDLSPLRFWCWLTVFFRFIIKIYSRLAEFVTQLSLPSWEWALQDVIKVIQNCDSTIGYLAISIHAILKTQLQCSICGCLSGYAGVKVIRSGCSTAFIISALFLLMTMRGLMSFGGPFT
ncbi:hypothetical protein BDR06DRAFT_969966 [Suillus hirtellus]|nr:hypothetical protein BDR06DRAFT_969966 [Suillus hirtellus]